MNEVLYSRYRDHFIRTALGAYLGPSFDPWRLPSGKVERYWELHSVQLSELAVGAFNLWCSQLKVPEVPSWVSELGWELAEPMLEGDEALNEIDLRCRPEVAIG